MGRLLGAAQAMSIRFGRRIVCWFTATRRPSPWVLSGSADQFVFICFPLFLVLSFSIFDEKIYQEVIGQTIFNSSFHLKSNYAGLG